MIRNSDNDKVRLYALDEKELGVYVRTGIHESKSDGEHVQAVLGSNDPSKWTASESGAGYTAHILYHDPRQNPKKST